MIQEAVDCRIQARKDNKELLTWIITKKNQGLNIAQQRQKRLQRELLEDLYQDLKGELPLIEEEFWIEKDKELKLKQQQLQDLDIEEELYQLSKSVTKMTTLEYETRLLVTYKRLVNDEFRFSDICLRTIANIENYANDHYGSAKDDWGIDRMAKCYGIKLPEIML